MGVTTAVPPTAYHLAFALPGPAQMLHFQGSSTKPLPILPMATLSEHIHGLWKEQAWPLHSSIFPSQGQAITEAIMLGMAHGVCDGSYMSEASPKFATATWLLKDSQFHIRTHVEALPTSLVLLQMLTHTIQSLKASMLLS